MSFQESLEQLCKTVPGARAAWVMSVDGITVAHHLEGGLGSADLEALLVELGGPIKALRNGLELAQAGVVRSLELQTELGIVVVRILNEEYFVALILAPGALVGRGRLEIRNRAVDLARELA
jgi:predicted regulator of Ras-like GTPase activity (Roadblock/LC7/MglB family)